MTDLIACLSTGKGTWLEVSKIMKAADWTHIYLIAPKFSMENFKHDKKFEFVEINPDGEIEDMKKTIVEKLTNKLDIDTAISIVSGTGREHMAVISAALTLGAGIRLVSLKNNNMEEI
ncbi:MAG: hypothetical protein PHO02_00520 [Candidatus Nanoarchaeia archaeon]|nr:hypothetical protein [Candidatus Nanoarchaeia archaeon]